MKALSTFSSLCKKYFSAIILFSVAVFMLLSVRTEKLWTPKNVFSHDVKHYYVYLPALFVHGDMSMKWTENTGDLSPYIYPYRSVHVGVVPAMTMGSAMVSSPFFLVAHFLSYLSGAETNGYNDIYAYCIGLCSFFLGVFGLMFIRKVLLRFYSEIVTGIALMVLAIGTNLYYYSLYKVGMAHSVSFFLMSVMLYCTVLFHDCPSKKVAIILGLSIGLLILNRPTNIVVILFPLLYQVQSWKGIRDKITFLNTHIRLVLLSIIACILVFVPQLLFWKYNTGQFVYNSYEEGNYFHWLSPKLLEGFFSYRKGWLLYTPIMSFALIGLFVLKKDVPQMVLSVVITFLLSVYIMFSWWCWWYGGAFSCRPMIDYYPLLALPLASCFKVVFRKLFIAIPVLLMSAFFIFLNLHQSAQAYSSIIHWDGMTKEAYWAVFLKGNSWPHNYKELIKRPDYQKAFENKE